MAGMTDQWTDRLSEYVDGDLDDVTRRALDAHLATCSACRETRDELVRVVSRARRIPYREPVRDLWPPIRQEIVRQPRRARPPRLVTLSLGRLAAAAAVLAMLAGGITWTIARREPPVTLAWVGDRAAPRGVGVRIESASPGAAASAAALAAASYRDAAADLERVLETGRGTLRPETMRVIEANLRSMDIAIAQADSALQRDPGSDYLNQHLATTMQRKLKLLRRAVEITTPRT